MSAEALLDSGSRPDWLLLEFDCDEFLEKSILDRGRRLIFYPAVGRMKLDREVDIQITVAESNILFPMKARVIEVRERPGGPDEPRGATLEIIRDDQRRFDRLCAFVDGVWKPTSRRAVPRFPASIKASYRYPKDKFTGETLDISVRGMFLRTEGLLPDSNIVIPVKLHPSLLRSIGLDCEVRWVDKVEGRRGMGLLCKGPKSSLPRLTELVRQILDSSRT